MEKNMILKEKDCIGFDLNTLNYTAVMQKYKKQASLKEIETSEVSSQMSSFPFSPTAKKTRKSQALQKNTIDLWLSKRGEQKECKVTVMTKSSECVGKRNKNGREKENRNNGDKQIEMPKKELSPKLVSPRASIKDTHSETDTNTSTKHNLKVTNSRRLKESSSGTKPSMKKSKKSIVESYLPQRKLDAYLNDKYKPKKHRDDNKELPPVADCSSSSSVTTRKDNSKRSLNNNIEPKRRNSKADMEQSLVKQENLNRSSNISVDKKYKRTISQVNYKKNNKFIINKSKSTSTKNDSSRLTKDGEKKYEHKEKRRTDKYNKLPIKISSNRNTKIFNENSILRKKNGSKPDLENSFDKQENFDKVYKSFKKRSRSKTQDRGSKSVKGQEKLDGYVIKKLKSDNNRKFTRSDSSESCELPSFKNTTKKTKKPKKDEFLKKYGISIPSVEEILKEQRDLEKYKQKIQSFQGIEDKSFELNFSVKDLNKTQETDEEEVLGCTHLSMDEITAAFKKNLNHISAVFRGEKFNERHERYYNDTNNYSLTIKDLCYNTSMIVFTFDQKEHMITLLKDEFDPDDKWTSYFFQVLLPELCMKIFMDTHGMMYDEAVKYLDTRPIIDD